MHQKNQDPSRVTRSKADAKAAYDRMSRRYDSFAGRFEKRFADAGVALVGASAGERILEIGYGTGSCMEIFARAVGPEGHVAGIDISTGMESVARRRLDRAALLDRVDLRAGDAADLPFEDASFDAVFMSFTLELFDTPEIPRVLAECRRVLAQPGRLVVVAMEQSDRRTLAYRLYLWSHRHFQSYVDCRPIPVADLLEEAGFTVRREKAMQMWRLPVTAVLAIAN